MGGFSSAFDYGRDLIEALTGPVGSGIIAWLLAGVFALSGGLKLRRPALAAMAIVDFGVSRTVRLSLGWLLGIGELLVAIGLLVTPRFGGLLAAVLLWFFVVLIARSLRAGHGFACYCFGNNATTLSHRTLLRTVALALLATLLATVAPYLRPLGADALLEAVVAAGVLGTVASLGYLPSLLRWNSDPFGEHRQEAQP